MIRDKNGPIHPQVAYVDGYGFGDRLLEGVKFKVEVKDGSLVSDGSVLPEHESYMEKFSQKQRREWGGDAVDFAMDSDMVDVHGNEVWWED